MLLLRAINSTLFPKSTGENPFFSLLLLLCRVEGEGFLFWNNHGGMGSLIAVRVDPHDVTAWHGEGWIGEQLKGFAMVDIS